MVERPFIPPEAIKKEVSCRLTNAIIKFTRSRGIDPHFLWKDLGVDEWFLTDVNGWVSASIFNALQERLRLHFQDERIMEQVGISVHEFRSFGFIHAAVYLLDDPTEIVNRIISGMSESIAKTNIMKVVEITSEHMVMTNQIKTAFPPKKDSCYFIQGCLGGLPKTWGLAPAQVIEEACQLDGAPECRYRVIWPRLGLFKKLGIWLKGRREHAEELINMLNDQNKLIEAEYEEALRKTQELEQAYFRIMESLLEALDTKDPNTTSHSRLVSAYAVEIAKADGFSKVQVEQIRKGALLHDIGKLGVPDQILVKPGPLTDEEIATMRRHPIMGEKILKHLSFLGPIIQIVAQEHERFDGSGYPVGLKGAQIHRGAQIIGIADALDAMTSPRPYRKPMTFEEAVAEIKRSSGTQFDPSVVDSFFKALSSIESIYRDNQNFINNK